MNKENNMNTKNAHRMRLRSQSVDSRSNVEMNKEKKQTVVEKPVIEKKTTRDVPVLNVPKLTNQEGGSDSRNCEEHAFCKIGIKG